MAIQKKSESTSVASMIATTKPVTRQGGAVPRNYPECWKDYLDALQRRTSRVLARGIPGTGKTYSANNEGVNDGEEVYNIYVGDETAAYQFMGSPSLKGGNSEFEFGPVLHAMVRGCRLVINEIDHASADALDALISVCDDPETVKVTLPNGHVIRPTSGYHVVATSNGDLQDLPEALADRFRGCVINITEPHPAAIEALPFELHDTARKLTRESCPTNQRVSIRQFRGFAELLDKGMELERAARLAFQERADDLMLAMDLRKLKDEAVTDTLSFQIADEPAGFPVDDDDEPF